MNARTYMQADDAQADRKKLADLLDQTVDAMPGDTDPAEFATVAWALITQAIASGVRRGLLPVRGHAETLVRCREALHGLARTGGGGLVPNSGERRIAESRAAGRRRARGVNSMKELSMLRFWFLALAIGAILFAGSFSAASAAGKVSHQKVLRPAAKQSPKKTINKPVVNKPIIKIGTAYVAELRHK